MAGRSMGFRHQEDVRKKIKSSMLINRLTGCATGEISLSTQQVNAIKILLSKSLPDLQSVVVTGLDGGPLNTSVTVEFKRPTS